MVQLRWTTRRQTMGLAALLTALIAVFNARPADAQATGRGFLFGVPAGAVTLRGGVDRANAGSDLFAFVTDELTLTKGDFRAKTIGGEVSVSLKPRIAAVFGAAFSRTNASSEFRHWLDNRDLPIKQTTGLRRAPITAGIKVALTPSGHSIGRLAWIPARFSPYVGAGGGMMYYQFRQSGDFIDFDTTRVFFDLFTSSGWTPTAHGLAGLDVSLNPRVVFTTEAKYEWARSGLSEDFSGFDRIDLSGLKMTVGVSFRY
ncbi:MAG: hypothetical protein ABI051_03635 [Vicinamibacterales bacterium]